MKPSTSTILAALARGECLTPIISLNKYRIHSCSQRCTELIRMGYPIISERVKGAKYNQYFWEL